MGVEIEKDKPYLHNENTDRGLLPRGDDTVVSQDRKIAFIPSRN
jgi:hypothetical protein